MHKDHSQICLNTKLSSKSKHAFKDIRLRPSIAMPFMAVAAWCSLHLSASRPLRPNVTSSIKREVHNVVQCCWKRTEPRPQAICTHNFMTVSPAVPEICSQTHRQTGCSQYSHPYQGRVMMRFVKI